jgi:hypothetical protein
MGSVVVQASSTLGALGAPGGPFGLEHYGTIRLGQHMRDSTDGVCIEQALHFLEGAYEAIVITDLVDQGLLGCDAGKLLSFCYIKAKGLLTKNVEIFIECGPDHVPMRTGRGCDDYRIQLDVP